jgi:xanthine dehydrogenase/oxidase
VEKYYNADLAFDAAQTYIDVSRLAELSRVESTAAGLTVGAAVPINDLVVALQAAHRAAPASTATFPEIARHCLLVANNQVRNVATWAGNIMIAAKHLDFPSDLVTTFGGAGCLLQLASAAGKRSVSVVDFAAAALAGEGAALRPGEMLTALVVPHGPGPGGGLTEVFDSWKIMPRHQNAHAYVNGAVRVRLDAAQRVAAATLCFGGLGRGLRVATKTAAFLTGRPLDAAALAGALPILAAECRATPHGAGFPGVTHSAAYRESLVVNLFYKFVVARMAAAPARLHSAVGHYQRPISSGAATFTPNEATAPLAMPVTKLEGYSQATGEAKYTDDIPQQRDELCAAFVYSRVSAGVIASIDAAAALAMPGVRPGARTRATLARFRRRCVTRKRCRRHYRLACQHSLARTHQPTANLCTGGGVPERQGRHGGRLRQRLRRLPRRLFCKFTRIWALSIAFSVTHSFIIQCILPRAL